MSISEWTNFMNPVLPRCTMKPRSLTMSDRLTFFVNLGGVGIIRSMSMVRTVPREPKPGTPTR